MSCDKALPYCIERTGVVVYTILMTWKRGREIVYTRMETNALPIGTFWTLAD